MNLSTDQYTRVNRDCPVSIDVHPADDLVEIVLGENRLGGNTLRLVVDHPDTFLLLAEALHHARNELEEHLRTKTNGELPGGSAEHEPRVVLADPG